MMERVEYKVHSQNRARPPTGTNPASLMKFLMRAVVMATLLFGAGCSLDATPATPPAANRVLFNEQVYPVLLRDCGFPECHGSLSSAEARFFRVYGPGRSRLRQPETDRILADDNPLLPVTQEELDRSFERARSMLAGADDAASTLLVRKPLAVDVGGASHMGRTALGTDVYASTDDPGYQILLSWAQTAYPGSGP